MVLNQIFLKMWGKLKSWLIPITLKEGQNFKTMFTGRSKQNSVTKSNEYKAKPNNGRFF